MIKIALTGPFSPAVRTEIERMLFPDMQLINVPDSAHYSLLHDVDYIIIRTVKLCAADIGRNRRLRLVQKWGAGYDNINVDSFRAIDVPVAVCAGINAQPVAEMAVLLMLAVYRNLAALNAQLKKNIWAKDAYAARSYLLHQKKVGLVGMGNIGRKVTKIVQGFGAKVQYYDLFRADEQTERNLQVTYLPLDALLQSSDIISLHVPLTAQTENLLDYQKLCLMKPQAILVNTARGGIVNEQDLALVLAEQRILGAGLDAFCSEPPGEDCPFIKMENVVMTPHAGGNTADNNTNMARRCIDNIQKIQQNEPLSGRDVVSPATTTKLEV